ncbi:MAG: cystathionine gamma-synthase [Acidimicrobiaceae bacterium]|nr:cystathionine gamma-synthase [Acidimicrobiaceae bacterium]|tara:strand:- start:1503 stop:2693 length:1191 start_codon:yes stop_codon:yes gene_type:complete
METHGGDPLLSGFEDPEGFGFETRAIRAGQPHDSRTGGVVTPIALSTTFAQDAVGQPKFGYEYARTGNPTRHAYETCLASLECAQYGFAFSSGMAAEDSLLRFLEPGDRIILGNDAYGGSFRLIDKIYGRNKISHEAIDLSNPNSIKEAWTTDTKLVWLETPTNPLLNVVDIQKISEITHELGGLLIVDNTFATPYLQKPISLGADAVVHSATKYLGGHSDVVGGFVATNNESLVEHLSFTQNAVGAVPSPFDCYLVLRGIKTLAVRMDRHCENAKAVVNFLSQQPKVKQVFYPGLDDHKGHAIAKKQMKDFGGMVSFTISGGRQEAEKISASTKVFTLAESLGAVESLIEHPGAMTHASVAGSPLEVPEDLIRLSIGIESIEDLLEDLESALSFS